MQAAEKKQRKVKQRKQSVIMMEGWIARAGQHARLSGSLHHNTGWKVNERPTHAHTDRHAHKGSKVEPI